LPFRLLSSAVDGNEIEKNIVDDSGIHSPIGDLSMKEIMTEANTSDLDPIIENLIHQDISGIHLPIGDLSMEEIMTGANTSGLDISGIHSLIEDLFMEENMTEANTSDLDPIIENPIEQETLSTIETSPEDVPEVSAEESEIVTTQEQGAQMENQETEEQESETPNNKWQWSCITM